MENDDIGIETAILKMLSREGHISFEEYERAVVEIKKFHSLKKGA